MSGLGALRGELGALTFARVTKMVYDDKHAMGNGATRTFSHFCGFSRTLDDSKKSVWFKKINHFFVFQIVDNHKHQFLKPLDHPLKA